MKSRLTTVFKTWILGMLAYLAILSPTWGQPPVELFELPSENSVMGPFGSCITAPVIACPPIYFGCPGDQTNPSNTGFATATPGDENCDNPVVSYADAVISEGPCNGAVEIHRTWTAIYPNNSNPYLYSDCTQLIILNDTESPTILNCPSDIEASPNMDCEASVTWTIPNAIDDCGLESFTSNYDSGDTFSLGTTTIIYTAVDSCGNESTCSFDIVVAGICCFEPPVLTCPEDFLGCPSAGIDPSVTGEATAESSGELCGEPTLTYTDNEISSGPCANEKIIERMWTATYVSNPTLISSCIQTIMLSDTKAPLITSCPSDITIAPNENCQAVVSWTQPVATDNCGIPTLSSNYESGSTFEEGANAVIYTAIDACGNESTCSFTVTISSCCDVPPVITCPEDYVGCPGANIDIATESNCTSTPSTYTGWAVATCNAEANSDDPVGVIYDIRNTGAAPQGEDWGTLITNIHPANWTLSQIGQVFGIALGENDDVYLGASDIYDTQYNTDPYGPGQIFKAEASNNFLATPFVNLPNSGGALNGIGNLVFDKLYNVLYASNLEDGKIYQIATDGSILATYDPWAADNGTSGIVAKSERVWGIGMNAEKGSQKIYFARINGTTRDMYSITLSNGEFPTQGSEVVEFSNIMGVGKRISDIAFSDNGSQMIFAERGTKFTTGAHDSKMLRYSLVNGTWQMDFKYFIGAWVTEQYPSIQVTTGENSAGGVTFGPTNVEDSIEGCDQVAWTTMNYFNTPSGNLYYGIQGIDVNGNNSSEASIDPNTETDIIIDFDGSYDNFDQKGDIGDVEIFQSGGSIIAPETGEATAESGGIGCGDPLITFTDEVISEGPCDGAISVERTWIATDSENSELTSICVQTITLEDNSSPVIANVPQDITLTPNANCSAVATWTSPSASDNCGVETFSFTHQSGDVFQEGITTVTYSATDGCGNSTSSSFTVTVTECCTATPIITCPQDYSGCPGNSINPDNTGQASAVAGSEYCGNPIITFDDEVISSGPCVGAKHIIRTWTATDPDNSTLSSSCAQVIILEDTTPPEVIDCPMDITVTTTGTSTIVTWIEPTAEDNCGLEWIMGDHLPGESFPIGTTLVTYTAIDDCENVTPCTFVITVESEGTIDCPDDIVVPCAGANGTVVTWELPEIETSCTSCDSGDSIPGFIYMGSLNGSLYYCSTSPAASTSATNIAESNGGHLAVITSQEENDLLSSFLVTQCALIGLSDSNSEGNFQWANGAPLEYTDWAYGQPNNDNGNQDCAVLCSDGWYDSHCEIAYEFIMEIPCTTYEQTTGPANGSVFQVGTETITYVVTDDCGTSLTCSFTVTVEEGVSLDCPDDITIDCPSGQSGVQAYWQVPELTSCCTDCSGTPDSIAGFMYMGSFGGSKYFCSLTNATWPNANIAAQANGGYLAEINDAAENTFLANILSLQKAWIGLNDANVEGSFVWSTNNPLTYTNWYPGQPNNKDNYQDYVAMLSNGLWNDEYNNLAMEYIMEIPCTSVTQIGGPWNGSILPIGTSTITYAGMDGCGNTDTCSFDITVSNPGTCASYGLDSWYMWIENVGLGDYLNVSGNNGGYADFTGGDCIEVESGEVYPIQLTPGFIGNLYTVYWKLWIDYNQDGDYFDAGEYVAYGNGYQQLNGNLPIANNCLLGETTMRVSMKYGSYPSGPCAIFTNGEVEDYCIDISGAGNVSNGFVSDAEAILLTPDQSFVTKNVASDLPYGEYENGNLKRESKEIVPVLNVFPNPANTVLNLEANIEQAVGFIIYNSEGRRVSDLSVDFQNGRAALDVSDLPNGIYLLRSTDGRFSEKVLVQR